MSERYVDVSTVSPAIPNGSGAAAVLAAGVGTFAFSVVALAGDKSLLVRNGLIFYKPTGPLSGVATIAVVIWILSWVLLEWRWGKKTVAGKSICVAALVLLATGLLLTFPPIVDLF